MSEPLSSYDFQIAYGPNNDRVKEFYVPALSRSIRYDRSAGFFSSSALAVAATGVAHLISNGGKMRLLVGAQLSEDDVKGLQGGADLTAVVAARMALDIDEVVDAISKERLAALAWMVEHGTLEVRVVLPKGKNGHPIPAAHCNDYYHPKTGIFTDSEANQVVFTGSINESEQAWLHNYEMFSVYCSWVQGLAPYISTHRLHFERLWQGEEEGWIGLTIPEAVKQKLLKYCPKDAPKMDPEELPQELKPPTQADKRHLMSGKIRERLVFQFLRDAPFLPNGHLLGQVSSTVRLWPHQEATVKRVASAYPQRFMLCDEVGLGKTLEAGAVAKQLLLAGLVKRCLILAPKSVCRQWQEELYEKFLINVPFYDDDIFTDYFRRELPCPTENPWDAFPVMIASSQLAKRRDRSKELYDAQPWDLILVDEAHHARRRDFLSGGYRRNRLLSLLLGPQDNPNQKGLVANTQCILLMTATPMQVDPREVWDLLKVAGLGGRWGASDSNFMTFFGEIRKGIHADWVFILSMVRDYLDNSGVIDPMFSSMAEKRIGLVAWETIKNLPHNTGKAQVIIGSLREEERALLIEFVHRHTPLASYVIRSTRDLLRKYQEHGLLGNNKVPSRIPELIWIQMKSEEMELYERIEEYIASFYKKYEAERKGLGFIMTVYRRRLTSSFYAVTKSLEKRLQFLRGKPDSSPIGGLTDEDVEEDDLDTDAIEELTQANCSPLYREEAAYIEDFLFALRAQGADTKVEHLMEDLGEMLKKRDTIIVFTHYTDTMDYLREKLRSVYGSAVACYSGRGGEIWDGSAWKKVSKDKIKQDFRDETVKILLGTESMSEGLNLQTCGMMINYDMPWNPMRVEQRIGRIDRIGQRYEDVWIKNYFYEETVEAKVYRALEGRIGWFETVVGTLQPILARIAKVIEKAAMITGTAREELVGREIAAIKRDMDESQFEALNLDTYVTQRVTPRDVDPPPVTQRDLEEIFLNCETTKSLFQPSTTIAGAYQIWLEGKPIQVTFDPKLFDEQPSSVVLLGYGQIIFDQFLAELEKPTAQDIPKGLLRLHSDNPPLCSYYKSAENGIESITSVSKFKSVLESEMPGLDTALLRSAETDFDKRIEGITKKQDDVRHSLIKGENSALLEEGKCLLLEATYIDLAMSLNPQLFGQKPNTAGFTEEAVKALKRHSYPFAPLLRLVDTEGIKPVASDHFWLKVQGLSQDSLRNRLEAVKKRITELLPKLKPRNI